MSAASNALWRSGRASVTRRTSPSRWTSRPALSHLESARGKLGEHRLDLAEDVGLVVAEVVEIRVEGGVQEPQLVVRQFDRVHGGTLTDPPARSEGTAAGGRGRPRQSGSYESFVR